MLTIQMQEEELEVMKSWNSLEKYLKCGTSIYRWTCFMFCIKVDEQLCSENMVHFVYMWNKNLNLL